MSKKAKRIDRWSTNESGREILVKIFARTIHRTITEEKILKKSRISKGTGPSAIEESNV